MSICLLAEVEESLLETLTLRPFLAEGGNGLRSSEEEEEELDLEDDLDFLGDLWARTGPRISLNHWLCEDQC